MSEILTADRVEEIFRDCLFRDDEDITNRVEVEGIINRFGYHPERLESYRQEIYDMLGELEDNFRASAGGGWSFLNACYDKHGRQWTGLHRTMDHLFTLGIGLGLAQYPGNRDLWTAFPGGVPYMVFLDTEESRK